VAIARALVKRGDRVMLTARDAAKLDALADDLATVQPARDDGAERPSAKHEGREDVSGELEGQSPSNVKPKPVTLPANLLDADALERIVKAVRASGGLDELVLACRPFPRT